MRVSQLPDEPTIVRQLAAFVVDDVGSDARLAREVPICRGKARVDLVAVNGHLGAYEVKSARDSLARLRVQAELYAECFEHTTVVCSTRHVEGALSLLPEWWGVAEVVDEDPHPIRKLREPGLNPLLKHRSVADLLWRHELIALLERTGETPPPRATRRELLDRCDAVATTELLDYARQSLKQRPLRWSSLR